MILQSKDRWVKSDLYNDGLCDFRTSTYVLINPLIINVNKRAQEGDENCYSNCHIIFKTVKYRYREISYLYLFPRNMHQRW